MILNDNFSTYIYLVGPVLSYRMTHPILETRSIQPPIAVSKFLSRMLPTGDEKVPWVFHVWKFFAMYSPWFPISRIVQAGTSRKLGKDELRAYDAPYPMRRFKAGARALPSLLPVTPDNPASEANRAAWRVLKSGENRLSLVSAMVTLSPEAVIGLCKNGFREHRGSLM